MPRWPELKARPASQGDSPLVQAVGEATVPYDSARSGRPSDSGAAAFERREKPSTHEPRKDPPFAKDRRPALLSQSPALFGATLFLGAGEKSRPGRKGLGYKAM